ncbi:MAG TPA: glycosyltransferase [Verrucomicrobiae bacterium]|nr:glycosyltransferase [Verrucomicrobiae bacterium]
MKGERERQLAKFLIIHPYMDIYGGGEKVSHQIIKSLLEHGQTVQLLTFEFDRVKYEQTMGEKLPEEIVTSLGRSINVKPPFSVYKRRYTFIKRAKKIKHSEFDYVFSTQTMTAFESAFFSEKKPNLAYVHFPEIHDRNVNSGILHRFYMKPYMRWLNQDISKLDIIFCNSNYTKARIEKYWSKDGIPEPIVAFPPVDLELFWCKTPLVERTKRVIYVGRFIPQKRHELMKKLAAEIPKIQFLSVGGLRETEEEWFKEFTKDSPTNYVAKPNLPSNELLKLYAESRVYCHLMEGEHFGITPIEALASGCVTLPHKSGGTGEFIPDEFRWQTYEDLKEKIIRWVEPSQADNDTWDKKRDELWQKITVLQPKVFREKVWAHVQWLMQQKDGSLQPEPEDADSTAKKEQLKS